jgi:hypothetical protein
MKKIVFHPFLFSLYSILFLIGINVKRVPFSASYRVLVYQLTIVTILFLLLRFLTKSWYRAGLVSSITVLLFNSYGHILSFFAGKQFSGQLFGRDDILLAIWAAAFIIIGWWFIRKLTNPQLLSEYFNMVSIIILIYPIVQIGNFYLHQAYYTRRLDTNELLGQSRFNPLIQRPPDIYYLILDEYGRADVLEEVLSFDNSNLIQYLQDKGFYIAYNSHSNYSISQFSLQSSLNFEYINAEDEANVYLALKMIDHNRARGFLESAGYQFITFATDYAQTDINDSDYYFAPKNYINGFEFMYFLSSALVFSVDDFYFPQSRAVILNAFTRLKEIPELNPNVPKFVFVHIPAAHVPYVFGQNGALDEPWTLPPPSTDPRVAREGYIRGYTGQIVYINKLLKETIDTILSKSSNRPIIILQGDHGPQSLFHFSFENTCIKERMSILNAYFLPGFDYQNLYPSISPVNTFRVIFDQYYNTKIGLLEDRSYLTIRDDLSRIVDVTDQLDDCQIP